MVRSSLIIISILFILNSVAIAQSAEHYDTLTYDDYMNGNWKELINHAKEAESKHALSLYGKKRLGYAYYMLKDFNTSVSYYQNVLNKDKNDIDAQTMLFLNYLSNGNTAQMNRIRGMMSDDLVSFLKLPSWKFLESIYAEGGITKSNNFDNDKENLFLNPHLFGAQILAGDMTSGQIGLRFYPSHSLSFYFAYKQFNISTEQRYGATILHLDSAYLYHPPNGGPPYMRNVYSNKDTFFGGKFTTVQNEFYISSTVAFENGNLTPYFHLINQNSDFISTPFHDSLYRKQPIDFRDTIQRIYSFNVLKSTNSNFVIGGSLSKQIGNFVLEGNLSYSNFESMNQVQVCGSLTYYPFGNNHFSIAPQFKYLNDSLNHNFISQLNISMMLHKYCWLTLYSSYGDLDHSNEQNGNVVFNNGDIFKSRYGGTFYIPLSRKINVYVDIQHQNCQSWIFKLTDLMHANYYWYDYQNNSLTIGLKYNL